MALELENTRTMNKTEVKEIRVKAIAGIIATLALSAIGASAKAIKDVAILKSTRNNESQSISEIKKDLSDFRKEHREDLKELRTDIKDLFKKGNL